MTIRLTPRAGRDRIDGLADDGALRARVAAPAVDGAANQALIRLVSRRARVPRTAVSLIAGERSRTKRLAVVGIDDGELLARLTG